MIDSVQSVAQSDSVVRRAPITSTLVMLFALSASWSGVKSLGFGLSDAFLAVACLFIFIGWANGRRRVISRLWMFIPPLGATLVLLIDIFLREAELESDSVEFVARMLLTTTVTAVVLASEIAVVGSAGAVRLLKAFLLGVFISAIAGIATTNGLVDLSSLVTVTTGERLYGLASHPNSLAFALAISMPGFIYLFGKVGRVSKVFVAVGLSACVYSLFLADSRAGLIVGLAALASSVIVAIARSRRQILLVPFILLGAVAAQLWLVPLLAQTRLAAGEGDGSDVGRIGFAQDAFRAFGAEPFFGSGYEYLAGVAVPLMLISAGGIVFAAAYYSYVLALVAAARRAKRDGVFALITLAAIVGFGLLNNGINERSTFIPVFLLLGTAAFATARKEAAGQPLSQASVVPSRSPTRSSSSSVRRSGPS